MREVEVELTKGKIALVDAADFDLVNQFSWCAVRIPTGMWYAMSYGPYGERNMALMHRFIMGEPEGSDVDHRNRDSLDNRRSNLRLATASQNAANSHRITACSGFKGVYPAPAKRWRARICVDGERMCIGTYDTPEEAATAYGLIAIQFFGEFARMSAAPWVNGGAQ